MGFTKKVDAPIVHQCVVPHLTGMGKGTTWNCDTCGDSWKVKTCLDEFDTYLEWCRTTVNGSKIKLLSLYKFPKCRHAEPSKYDIDRERRIKLVLAELDVSARVLDVISLENSAAFAPYHGYQHLLTVALNCKEAANYYSLDRETTRALVLAALFHDYGHLLNQTVKDSLNIQKAIEGASAYLTDANSRISLKEGQIIVSLIRATEYPHYEATTLPEKIIQDADMMQTLEPDGDRFIAGLGAEKGMRITKDQNSVFLDSVPGQTEWGQKKLHPFAPVTVSQ